MAKDLDIKVLLELLGMAEDFRPLIEKCFTAIEGYGPNFYRLFEKMIMASTDLRIAQIKKLEESGFTREEAIFITMDEWFAIKRFSRSSNKQKQS